MMKMKVKHIHVCHSHCCINCRTQPLLLNQLLSVPATAWQERHAEEDFLALVRHNAAAQVETEQ